MVLGVWASHAESRELSEMPMSVRHEQWMARYGRVYNDAAEQQRRLEIYESNVKLVETFNAAANHKYKLGTNQFADLTNEEFRAIYNGFRPSKVTTTKAAKSFRYENVTAVPSTMDWRKKGAVTPIKDQGQCGEFHLTTSLLVKKLLAN